MNSRIIKIVAILTMTVDHVGFILFPRVAIFRIIGRIAMPLFCLLIAYGATKTRSCAKYFLRLIIPAFIFQFFFNLFNNGNILKFDMLNVFFSLSFGVLAVWLLRCKIAYYIGFAGALLILIVSYLLPIDYGAAGVLLIILFYLALSYSVKMLKLTAVLSLGAFNLVLFLTNGWLLQFFSVLSLFFILLFVDRKLNISRLEKLSFYIYYPLHMIVIFGISLL